VIDGGYFPKVIERSSPALKLPPTIHDICSASTCIYDGPDGWIDQWRHNEFGWFNTIEDAWAVTPEPERSRYRLFAYRIAETRFRNGAALTLTVPADVHPVPIPDTFTSLGYDAVSKSMESVLGFECSPLSCNSMAAEMPTNEHCLFDTEAAATAAAMAFSVDEPEPGDYYVVEVLEQKAQLAAQQLDAADEARASSADWRGPRS
jgi:hypothetical protein